jgi:uncharacterized protein
MGRLHRLFAPRGREFFELFEQAGANVLRAAELLEEMLRLWPERPELAAEIVACEQEGDRITHGIIRRLNESSVAPIDREDVYELASALDDVVDYSEEVADYMGIYRIEAPMEQAQRQAEILLASARQVHAAVTRMRDPSRLPTHTAEIDRLEDEGDRVMREAMASLFRAGIDPMVVIRWKDIYERLEAAIDATERVANVLAGVAAKRS